MHDVVFFAKLAVCMVDACTNDDRIMFLGTN
jgi:hypothetical protein